MKGTSSSLACLINIHIHYYCLVMANSTEERFNTINYSLPGIPGKNLAGNLSVNYCMKALFGGGSCCQKPISQFIDLISRRNGLNWDFYRTAGCDRVHLHTTI